MSKVAVDGWSAIVTRRNQWKVSRRLPPPITRTYYTVWTTYAVAGDVPPPITRTYYTVWTTYANLILQNSPADIYCNSIAPTFLVGLPTTVVVL